jgi:NmrA-like family
VSGTIAFSHEPIPPDARPPARQLEQVTGHWPAVALAPGRNLVDIPRTEGGFATPQLDAKSEANAFFTELQVPTTFLQTAYYYESLIGGLLTRDPRGEPVLSLPLADSSLALIGAEDIGRTALTILRHPGDYIGRTVSVAGAHSSGEELAAMISEVAGEKVRYRPFTWEQFRSLPFPTAVTAANAFQYFAETEREFLARRDLEESRRINPQMVPLDEWLRSHRSSLLPPAAASWCGFR